MTTEKQVLLFQTHVDDKKHGLEFDKDRVSYRHKTFDAVLTHEFRDILKVEMIQRKLAYPILLTINDDDYFMKAKKFTRSNGEQGVKEKIVIKSARAIEQGKFESKSLDDVCDEIENSIQVGMAAYSETDDVDED